MCHLDMKQKIFHQSVFIFDSLYHRLLCYKCNFFGNECTFASSYMQHFKVHHFEKEPIVYDVVFMDKNILKN